MSTLIIPHLKLTVATQNNKKPNSLIRLFHNKILFLAILFGSPILLKLEPPIFFFYFCPWNPKLHYKKNENNNIFFSGYFCCEIN